MYIFFLFKNILVSHTRVNLLGKSIFRSDMIKEIQITNGEINKINNKIGVIINQIMDGINNQIILEIMDGEINHRIQDGEANKIFIILIGEINLISRILIGEINHRIQVGVTNSHKIPVGETSNHKIQDGETSNQFNLHNK